MDLYRLVREVREARTRFPNLDSYPTESGSLLVLVALQTSLGRMYTLEITFEHYPNLEPRVRVRKPNLDFRAPHQYEGSRICYIHPKLWNPGLHNLTFVIARSAKWLNKYEVWRNSGNWPGAGHDH